MPPPSVPIHVLTNGIRGSLKQTDFEWCSWEKNDSISFTIDLLKQEKLNIFALGCITNYGMGVHKPRCVRIEVSDNNTDFREVASLHYTPQEIFREGTFREDLSTDLKGCRARYVRVVLKGAGKLPACHVRPGQESRIYVDEVSIK